MIKMPNNSSAILSREEPTGTAQLPLARVKKIISIDEDITQCSNNAAFVIALATEMFVQHLTTSAHTVVKSERKPRKNIQYRDLAAAISRTDSLEFLSDTIPRTIPYKEIKSRRANGAASHQTHISQIPTTGAPSHSKSNSLGALDGTQSTLSLNGAQASPEATKARMERAMGFGNLIGEGEAPDRHRAGTQDDDEEADPNTQLEMESRNARSVNGHGVNGNGREGLNGAAPDEDVEMS